MFTNVIEYFVKVDTFYQNVHYVNYTMCIMCMPNHISFQNDNTPVFTGAIEFTLLENLQNVTYVGKLMAEDRDAGRNGALVFAPGVPSTYSNEYIEAMNAITILKDGSNLEIVIFCCCCSHSSSHTHNLILLNVRLMKF